MNLQAWHRQWSSELSHYVVEAWASLASDGRRVTIDDLLRSIGQTRETAAINLMRGAKALLQHLGYLPSSHPRHSDH